MEEFQVTFYTKNHCPLCDEAEEALQSLKDEFSFTVDKVDIYTNDNLLETYQIRIPVIEVGGHVLAEGIVRQGEVRKAFLALREGRKHHSKQ